MSVERTSDEFVRLFAEGLRARYALDEQDVRWLWAAVFRLPHYERPSAPKGPRIWAMAH